jgi:hypothetical protein
MARRRATIDLPVNNLFLGVDVRVDGVLNMDFFLPCASGSAK